MTCKHCFFVFWIFLSFAAFARTPNEGERSVCVLNAVNISPGISEEENRILKQYFKENLIQELDSEGFYTIAEDIRQRKQQELGFSDQDLIEGPSALVLAEAIAADVVIIQFFHIKDKRITLGIKCYDVKTRSLAVQHIIDTRYGLNMATPIYEFIQDMIPRIKDALEEIPELGEDIVKDTYIEETVQVTEFVEKGNVVQLRFLSLDEGAQIFLADEEMGSIHEGQLEISVQADSELIFEIRKEGFHPRNRRIRLGKEDTEYSLKPLMKRSRWGIKTDYALFQFLGTGLGVRYYIQPDLWGLELVDYPYFQLTYKENSNVLLHNETSLNVFFYPFFPPDNLFRFTLGAGMGGIGTFYLEPEFPVFYDFFSELGLTLELNFTNFLIYYKWYGRYTFAVYDLGVLGTGMMPPIGQYLSLGVLLKW